MGVAMNYIAFVFYKYVVDVLYFRYTLVLHHKAYLKDV
jgi:hypothetical protein